jgi:acyl-CoA synthetase (AMP-forming)/AMP-acid ligase II
VDAGTANAGVEVDAGAANADVKVDSGAAAAAAVSAAAAASDVAAGAALNVAAAVASDAAVDTAADLAATVDAGLNTSSFTTLIACGGPVGQEVRIVDPASRAELAEGAVGEILVRGPNVGLGYWKHAEQSAEVFGAQLPGTGEQPWLRTGDLGAIHAGLLLVTGRLKDLLIIDGRNHYPQDVEETVHAALDADRRERAAVFAVPGEEGESVVAVAERRRDRMKRGAHLGSGSGQSSASASSSVHVGGSADHADYAEHAGHADHAEHAGHADHAAHFDHASHFDHVVRAQVAGTHGLRLDRLVLVPPGTIPRTSSGKVSRSACRAAYLRGEYAEGHR